VPQSGDRDRLFTTHWVHLFEQDSAAGEVYAPDDGPIPLSRRPRARLELKADGSATVYAPGADDRPAPRPARWTERDGHLMVKPDGGGPELRIVQRSADRLVIARGPAA
jgi:hypothetical protein